MRLAILRITHKLWAACFAPTHEDHCTEPLKSHGFEGKVQNPYKISSEGGLSLDLSKVIPS